LNGLAAFKQFVDTVFAANMLVFFAYHHWLVDTSIIRVEAYCALLVHFWLQLFLFDAVRDRQI